MPEIMCKTCGAETTKEVAIDSATLTIFVWVCRAPGCTHTHGQRGQTLAEGGRGGRGGHSAVQHQELVPKGDSADARIMRDLFAAQTIGAPGEGGKGPRDA